MITIAAAEFRAVLAGGRLLGLDVGTKTIGTARCDAEWSFASPALLMRRTQQVKGLVIGLPLNLDGTDSPRTQSTRAFARNLGDMGFPILLWDERWSTVAVERTLIEQDASRARRAELIDKMAAAYILQGAIDALIAA